MRNFSMTIVDDSEVCLLLIITFYNDPKNPPDQLVVAFLVPFSSKPTLIWLGFLYSIIILPSIPASFFPFRYVSLLSFLPSFPPLLATLQLMQPAQTNYQHSFVLQPPRRKALLNDSNEELSPPPTKVITISVTEFPPMVMMRKMLATSTVKSSMGRMDERNERNRIL